MRKSRKYMLAILSVFLLVVGIAVAKQMKVARAPKQLEYPDEVHVHSDFLIVINDEIVDLTDEKYQTTKEHPRHLSLHLHDGEDHVLHRHDEYVTFSDFLLSLGFTLSQDNQCLTTDEGKAYCADTNNVLQFVVNGEVVDDAFHYVSQEGDQMLLYYGVEDETKIQNYYQTVTDESCIYSGLCPERGDPPSETCALSCDVTGR